MGNAITTPKRQFQINQPVVIVGSEVSLEHVPEELPKFGKGAYVTKSLVAMKSRPNAPDIGVTRVRFPNGRDEAFLTNDLYSVEEAKSIGPITRSQPSSQSGYNTGCRVLNNRRMGGN